MGLGKRGKFSEADYYETVERIFQTMSQDIGKNVRATDLRYTVMQRAFQQEKRWSTFNKKWAMYGNGC